MAQANGIFKNIFIGQGVEGELQRSQEKAKQWRITGQIRGRLSYHNETKCGNIGSRINIIQIKIMWCEVVKWLQETEGDGSEVWMMASCTPRTKKANFFFFFVIMRCSCFIPRQTSEIFRSLLKFRKIDVTYNHIGQCCLQRKYCTVVRVVFISNAWG